MRGGAGALASDGVGGDVYTGRWQRERRHLGVEVADLGPCRADAAQGGRGADGGAEVGQHLVHLDAHTLQAACEHLADGVNRARGQSVGGGAIRLYELARPLLCCVSGGGGARVAAKTVGTTVIYSCFETDGVRKCAKEFKLAREPRCLILAAL